MKKILLALGLFLFPQLALAQAPTKICVESSDGRSCVQVSSTAPFPVTAAASSGTSAVAIAPSSSTSYGITPVATGSALATLVLKASPGNLYSVYATNLTPTAGFLAILNATSAPADGAIVPIDCVPLPANGNASINFNPGPAAIYSVGITAVLTSSSTCFTKTTGVLVGHIRGAVQ